MMRDIIRRVRFTPYRRGMGPTFTLIMYATGRYDSRGCSTIEYELRQHLGGYTTIVFRGDDFNGSPMNADDSDATVCALMGFLTLRPGDTDDEWFDNYTTEQRAYCDMHAETLNSEVSGRFDPEGKY
jgi:hypothetical protein